MHKLLLVLLLVAPRLAGAEDSDSSRWIKEHHCMDLGGFAVSVQKSSEKKPVDKHTLVQLPQTIKTLRLCRYAAYEDNNLTLAQLFDVAIDDAVDVLLQGGHDVR